jgi:hypothetical protein
VDGGCFRPSRINPIAADLKVNLKDLAISPFQAYFTDRVKMVSRTEAFREQGTSR